MKPLSLNLGFEFNKLEYNNIIKENKNSVEIWKKRY